VTREGGGSSGPEAQGQHSGSSGPAAQDKMVDVFSDTEAAIAASRNPSGYAVAELGDRDQRVLTLSADLSNTLAEFRERHPDRYIELGIAETNSVSLAAGLAASGFLPYIFSMAPFGVIKCAEQLRTDVAYNHLPVRLVGRLTGLAMGFFGTSHHAIEDIAIARTIPNMTVVAPADGNAVLSLVRSTADLDGPAYIRVSEATRPVYDTIPSFEPGRWPRLRAGSDVSLVGHGMGVGLAVAAAAELAAEGVKADVYDAAYLKPFDEDAIAEMAQRTGRVVTIEDHTEVGGLASIVAEVAGRRRLGAALARVCLPDRDLEVGVPAELYDFYGLNVSGVVGAARTLLGPAG
jgi:transketolase